VIRLMEFLIHDCRLAARHVRAAWPFAAAAVVTLALGIGANVTLFSLADSVLFRPLPVRDADRVVIAGESQTEMRAEVSYLNFKDWQARSRAFDGLAAMGSSDWPMTLLEGEPVAIAHRAVSGEFFTTLGVQAALGRTLDAGDDQRGAARALVVSHGLWQRQFGGDAAIVGRSITLDGRPFTVVGVMPRGFTYPFGTDAWSALVPLFAGNGRPELPDFLANRDAAALHVLGRLKPGVSVAAARADLDRVVRELASEFGLRDSRGARITPLRDELLGPTRPAVWALVAAVGLLLLVAAANVAGLMIVQATKRRREFAVRMALGASRRAIARQLFCETSILVAVASFLALAIARIGVPAIVAWAPQDIPRLDEVAVNLRVVTFTALVGATLALLCWIAPALSLDSRALDAKLRTSGRGFASGGFSRPARRLLVVGEIAVAMVVLVFSGLLYRSVSRLGQIDLGFTAENLLAVDVDPPRELESGPDEAVDRFYDAAIATIAGTPGVVSAGAAYGRPLKGPIGLDSSWRLDGQLDDEAARNPWLNVETVTPGYFQAMQIRLRDGRLLDDRDRDTTQPVVVVNEKLARWAWPGQSAIGRRVRVAALDEWSTVVGVVSDVRYRELTSARFDLYVSYRQSPFSTGDVLVRIAPAVQTSQIRARLRAINPSGVIRITPMAELVALHRSPWTATFALFGAFAWLTVVLAIVGLYALLAVTVAERAREIGIRLALGAGSRRIVALVIGEGVRIALWGVAAGVVAALVGGRLIRALLFETNPFDPRTFAAAPIALVAVAIMACAFPAITATRIDPAISLRAE
jgi:putative ABC transport system permease protein